MEDNMPGENTMKIYEYLAGVGAVTALRSASQVA